MSESQNEAIDLTLATPDRKGLIDHVEVVCEAILGNGTISIGSLSQLGKGDIIALDRTPADPVDIRLSGKVIARGEIITLNDKFAVRLTEIGLNEPEG